MFVKLYTTVVIKLIGFMANIVSNNVISVAIIIFFIVTSFSPSSR